jgi:hypothetical protein
MLQWTGVAAAPAAWVVQYVVGVFLSQAHCEVVRWNAGWEPTQIALTTTAAVIALVGEAAAYAAYRALRRVDIDEAGALGREHFLAIGGLLGNVLFFVAIILTGATVVGTQACRQG